MRREPAGEIRVLHVDDEPEFGDLTATLLEREDERFTVETVAGPDEALDRLADDVDCVVSDYDMPGTNGVELLETVRERRPDLPFILFTGKGSEEVAGEAISAGVTDYLQKETGTDQYSILANRIANAVEARRSATEAERERYRFEQILKTVPDCVVQLDREGNFEFANDRAREVLGLSRAEVTDRTYNDPEWEIRDLDGEAIPDDELPFARVRESGEPLYDYRHTVVWPDGTRKTLSVNGAPLLDDDGAVEGAVFSLTDITERLERERELERQNDLFAKAQDIADVGAWEHFPQADAGNWTDKLYEIHDLPPDTELDVEAALQFYHPDDRPEIRDALTRAIEEGEPYDIESRFVTAEGDHRWVRTRGEPQYEDGELVRIRGTLQDITERKQREYRLRRQNERLAAFASVVSHDLRNPLTVARTRVDVARQASDSDDLAAVSDALDRMEDLIDTMLALARDGDAIDDPESVALADLAETAWFHVDTGDATLVVDTDSSVRADPDRLQQLFENLFRNAVEHGSTSPRSQAHGDAVEHGSTSHRSGARDDAPGHAFTAPDSTRSRDGEQRGPDGRAASDEPVTVTVGDLDDGDGFYVADDGRGIPPELRDRVFEEGYSTAADGIGFGLLIVGEVVEAHGWAVDVTESEDGGARFEFSGVETAE